MNGFFDQSGLSGGDFTVDLGSSAVSLNEMPNKQKKRQLLTEEESSTQDASFLNSTVGSTSGEEGSKKKMKKKYSTTLERMATKVTVKDLPVEMDSTTLERMATKVTVKDLPVEMDSTTLERMATKVTVKDLPAEMDSTTLERMAAKVTVNDLPVEMDSTTLERMVAKVTVKDLSVEMDSTTLEIMAAKLTVTDLPLEMDSTTLESMSTIVTVMDIPVELLVKIFSFLEWKKLPKLFTVCSKFNAAAKDPSLWRRCEFNFSGSTNDPRRMSSFCRFFSQYPFFRVLSITEINFYALGPLDDTTVNSFNHLFENLKHLSCLELNIDLSNIGLPSSLRHLTCYLSNEVCEEDKFSFLDQCPKIERLHLEEFPFGRLTTAVRSVLLKYQLTLTALYLKISYFEEDWIPLIANCLSLKELGLEITRDRQVDLSKLFGSSLSSRLVHLHVTNIFTLPSFDGFGFPELKVLTIESLVDLMEIIPIIKRMPKLRSLRFSGEVSNPNTGDFCTVVKRCKTLRYLLIKTNRFDFEPTDEFEIIIRKLNEGSSEENQWKLNLENFGRYFVMPSFECNCWNPTKISIDQNQHKQLLVLEEEEEEDCCYEDDTNDMYEYIYKRQMGLKGKLYDYPMF